MYLRQRWCSLRKFHEGDETTLVSDAYDNIGVGGGVRSSGGSVDVAETKQVLL